MTEQPLRHNTRIETEICTRCRGTAPSRIAEATRRRQSTEPSRRRCLGSGAEHLQTQHRAASTAARRGDRDSERREGVACCRLGLGASTLLKRLTGTACSSPKPWPSILSEKGRPLWAQRQVHPSENRQKPRCRRGREGTASAAHLLPLPRTRQHRRGQGAPEDPEFRLGRAAADCGRHAIGAQELQPPMDGGPPIQVCRRSWCSLTLPAVQAPPIPYDCLAKVDYMHPAA